MYIYKLCLEIKVFSLLTTRLSVSPVNSPQSALFDDLRMRLKNQLFFFTELRYEYIDITQFID